MTIEELLDKMRKANECDGTEERHSMLDELLLAYVNDERVKVEYNKRVKWYA